MKGLNVENLKQFSSFIALIQGMAYFIVLKSERIKPEKNFRMTLFVDMFSDFDFGDEQ